MATDAPIRLERDGGLAVLSVDSPPVNLFDEPLHAALRGALDELEARPPRTLLFRAEGRVVSGGVDVSLFAAQEGPESARALWVELIALGERIEALACPTVFAAHALCLTWAFEIALACDIILAAESAAFGLVEKVVGLTPAMGGTQRLADRAGTGRALELVMTGTPYPAATLERWNVVNRVLADDGFDAAARRFAGELAAGPTRAHAATKQIVGAYREGGVPLANARTPEIAGALFATEDLQQAVRSFLREGPGRASFTGR